MSKHTPGPWEAVSRSDQWTDIKPLGAGFEYAAVAIVSDLGEQAGKMYANAARIVRCVNAFEPGGVVEQLAEACKQSLRLPTLSVYAMEDSESHHHGPKRAREYADKERAVLNMINAALAAYEAMKE